MASATFEDRHNQVVNPPEQLLNSGQQLSHNITTCSYLYAKSRSPFTYGNFPAYYRARLEFRASCTTEVITRSGFQRVRDAVDSIYCSCRPSLPKGTAEEVTREACEKRCYCLPVDSSYLYDLDWRLGSVADFDKRIFAGKDVLDLGCNTGKVSLIVASLMQAQNVLGADIDAKLIMRARSELRYLQRRYRQTTAQDKHTRVPIHHKLIHPVKDLTNSVRTSTMLCATPSREDEATGFLSPPAITRTTRKLTSLSVSTDAAKSPLDGSPRSRELLRCSGDVPLSDTGISSAMLTECVRNEGCSAADAQDLRVIEDGNSTASPARVKTASSSELVKAPAAERPDYCDLSSRRVADCFLPSETTATKRFCTRAEVSQIKSEILEGNGSVHSIEEAVRGIAERHEYPSASRRQSPHTRRLSKRQRAFPHNISFCVADVLAGRPWSTPAICSNTCGPDVGSACCFCELIGEIGRQQAYWSEKSHHIPGSVTEDDVCGATVEQECGQTDKGTTPASIKWEELGKAFDVIICFSLTKWVHLHHGDKGILLLFARLHALLRDRGLLLLEPQDWASYRRARRTCVSFKMQLRCIRFVPRMFCSVLTGTSVACRCENTVSCNSEVSGDRSCIDCPKEGTGTPLIKSEPSGSLYCSHPEETNGAPLELMNFHKQADRNTDMCMSHAYPFGLLAVLHPWSDLKKSAAQTLVKRRTDNVGSKSGTSRCRPPLPLPPDSEGGEKSTGITSLFPRVFENGSFNVQRGTTHLHADITARSSVHDKATRIHQWRDGRWGSDAVKTDQYAVATLQKITAGDQEPTSEFEGEARQQRLPPRQERVAPCTGAWHKRRSQAMRGGSERSCEANPPGNGVPQGVGKALTNERSVNHCNIPSKCNSVEVSWVHEGVREVRQEGFHLGTKRDSPITTYTPAVAQQRDLKPGEDEPMYNKRLADRESMPRGSFTCPDTCTGEAWKGQANVSFGYAQTSGEPDITSWAQDSQVKPLLKSEGTLASRFVYVLQKQSPKFTLCCKHLQRYAHARVGGGVTPSAFVERKNSATVIG